MLELAGGRLSLDAIALVAEDQERVSLSPESIAAMEASRAVIDAIVLQGQVVYGVNTGFGRLAEMHIPDAEIADLQLNLVRSHAVGVGEPLSIPEVRAMMALRANQLAKGYSGVRHEVPQLLLDMLNQRVTPVVPSRGSVGASGDLAPLAHLSLVLIGEGQAFYRGKKMPGGEALSLAGLRPLRLAAKEGLALTNGTQAMQAVGGLALKRATTLAAAAGKAGAMSLEALKGTPTPFDERIQRVRPHEGQARVAKALREELADSEIRESHRFGDGRVQDAYSLRCMPAVHGAVWGALDHVRTVLETETEAATDNPLVFATEGEVLSGGNFHGAPLALAFDYAAIALTQLASISERRIDRLTNPDASEGLPPFLTEHAGSSSGFMMAQVTAAALLNEMRVLSHPASTDSVPTSGGKEDHVSMGMTSALKLRQATDLCARVLAIELLAGAQGLEFRKPLRPGAGVRATFDRVRGISAPLVADRPLGGDVEALAADLANGGFWGQGSIWQ